MVCNSCYFIFKDTSKLNCTMTKMLKSISVRKYVDNNYYYVREENTCSAPVFQQRIFSIKKKKKKKKKKNGQTPNAEYLPQLLGIDQKQDV